MKQLKLILVHEYHYLIIYYYLQSSVFLRKFNTSFYNSNQFFLVLDVIRIVIIQKFGPHSYDETNYYLPFYR